MEDELAKDKPSIQADNQSIAIGEINITGTVTGNITIGHTIVQPADARLRHELGILLKNVQTTWIKGVLEKSVHEAALLELGLELHEEAVDNPWRMVIEGPNQTQQTLPRGIKIKDIFDEANRLLLILGEPGSGKTTTLLQLARDLIAEVDDAFTQPVPVILNLSTWTNKTQPLDEWLVAELNSKYRLPKKDGQRWLKERRILPLLDGLDEVRAENRAACVEEINQLVTDYGLQGLVVCSRIKDYTDLNVRLAFYRAIYIQPLTPEQVDEYLNEAGDKLTSLRATLQADEALRSMAQSPLILNIMSLAYQNTSAEDLSDPAFVTDKARRKHLFDTYINRMFNRKASARPYEDEKTKRQLSWLAGNMQKHNQEVFLIEGLQPSWLLINRWQWVYFIVSRLVSGLSFGLSYGFGLNYALYVGWVSLAINWIGAGLITGLSLGIIDVWRFRSFSEQKRMMSTSIIWKSVINIVVIGLIGTLISWMIFGPISEIISPGSSVGVRGVGLITWVGMSISSRYSDALSFGLAFGLIFGLRVSGQGSETDIKTIESFRWSWPHASIGGLIGGLIGLTFGLIAGLMIWLSIELSLIGGLMSGLHYGLRYGRISALFFGLIGTIMNGLRYEIIENKPFPNQGIWLSIRNAVIVALLSGFPFGMLIGLINWQSPRLLLFFNLSDGLIIGLGFGLIAALWYGGLDVIQHYTLRLILLIQGYTPANYARFLDYAVDRIFLQKVGGGYRFIHRLLLEHFAEMDPLLSPPNPQ